MFKKAVEAKSQQRLSGADKKKLKRTIKLRFRDVSDADIDAILPPKVEITIAKFQNRVHVYGVENGFPMFFDIDGRGIDIFPTVYALWTVPELLPAFMLKGGEVSRYIIGGADLMFPGISIPAEGFPSFLVGEPWAVKVPGNSAPIAVGVTTMSSSEALKAGLRGKALRITHFYGDSLWESAEGCYVPNAGFFEDAVFEDSSLASSSQVSDFNENEGAGQSVVEDIHSEIDHAGTSHRNANISEEITIEMDKVGIIDNISANESIAEEHTMTTEDVDSLLDKCLLQALHVTVKDKDLPLPGSILWSNHVLPCRPSGVTLDIKKSSNKKLSKWLQTKSTTGLLTVKEDKFKKEAVIIAVNRNHPEYTSFKPEKKQIEIVDQTSDPSVSEVRSNKLLEVVEIYKPSVHVNPIFASVGADTAKLFSASEATDIVFEYIEIQNLVKTTNRSIVVLDAALCDALFKGLVKKGSTYPTEIHKKDLGSAFINRMQAHHLVTRGSDSVIRKGALKPIQIMTERRQGNKKMTRVSGLESFLIDCEALASELQKKFACSTSVAELPGKKGHHEVLVQGGVIDDLGVHLVGQYGISKRYIEVYDKTKK